MIELVIDQEFRTLIPSLTVEEQAQLEANLLAEGCRDPLVVWAGADAPQVCGACQTEGKEVRLERLAWEDEERWIPFYGSLLFECPECLRQVGHPWTLLDGHHRYAICQAHNLGFAVVEAPAWVKTREEAKIWIIQHQLARRNLEPYQRAELALALAPMIAAQAKRQQGRRSDLLQNAAESFRPLDTREEVAKRAGVSHDTLRKAKVILHEADEPTKDALRRGERTIHGVYTELRRAPEKANEPEVADASSGPATPVVSRGHKKPTGAIWQERVVEVRHHVEQLEQRHPVEDLVRTWSLDVANGYLVELQQFIAQLQAVAKRVETVIREQVDG
jgi:ParB-like chromosome segregation protein Spo0J